MTALFLCFVDIFLSVKNNLSTQFEHIYKMLNYFSLKMSYFSSDNSLMVNLHKSIYVVKNSVCAGARLLYPCSDVILYCSNFAVSPERDGTG